MDFGTVAQVEQYGGEERIKRSAAVAYVEQYGDGGRIKTVEDLLRMYKSIGLIENYVIAELSGKQNRISADGNKSGYWSDSLLRVPYLRDVQNKARE